MTSFQILQDQLPSFQEAQKILTIQNLQMFNERSIQISNLSNLTSMLMIFTRVITFRSIHHQVARRVAVEDMGWELIKFDDRLRKFEAIATTPVLQFKEDVVVQVVDDIEVGSALHIRSKSRSGKSDMGTNANRIRSFISYLLRAPEIQGWFKNK